MPFNPRELLVIDTETTGLRWRHGAMPFAVPLCDEEGNTWYTEWKVDPFTRIVTPDESDLRFLRKHFENPRTRKVFFNAKFDIGQLSTVGLRLLGPIEDVGVQARVCDTLRLSFDLKGIADEHGIIGKDDELFLQAEVERMRRIVRQRKLGWKLSEKCEADYWVPRTLDPANNACQDYATKDVYPRTLLLYLFYSGVVMKDEPEFRATYEFEMREVWPAIQKIEARGIRIDKERNDRDLAAAKAKADREEGELRAMLVKDRKEFRKAGAKGKAARDPFNPNSPDQLRRVLYDDEPAGYGLICHRTSKKSKQPSTDWKALREHLTHPFVSKLVQCRSARKGEGTYFGNYAALLLPDPLNVGGHCIYANLNQLGAAKSSRLSANDPNFQNVGDANNNPNSPAPIQARSSFGPRPGYFWYSLDWSGQEVRIFADVAKVELMLESIANGRDIPADSANLAWGGKGNPHAITAAAYSLELGNYHCSKPEVRHVWRELGWSEIKATAFGFDSPQARAVAEKWLARFDYDIVKAEKSIGKKLARTRAKNLTYAKIYGAGVGGVIDMLYCTRREAMETLNRFDEIYPGIVEFCEEFATEARHNGFIHNLFKRKLLIDREHAYRAVNYLVQGSAADMMKRAFIRCIAYLESTGLDAHLILSVHDELIFEVAIKHAYHWLLRGLRDIMQGVSTGVVSVPMPVECNRITRNWATKYPVELGEEDEDAPEVFVPRRQQVPAPRILVARR